MWLPVCLLPFPEQIFRIEREGESQRYKPFRQLHNRRLLWHGSRATNFAGILSQGLRIAPPEAPVVGGRPGAGGQAAPRGHLHHVLPSLTWWLMQLHGCHPWLLEQKQGVRAPP